MELDGRLYRLQKTDLNPQLASLLRQADTYYLQDRDTDAEILVEEIEILCKWHGISLSPMTFLRTL